MSSLWAQGMPKSTVELLMDFTQILREQRGAVLVLTLNRPEKLNAWTPRMGRELSAAIEEADADASIGAIVVAGAGRGFCAGADVSQVFDAQIQGEHDSSSAPTQTRDWVEQVRSCKPIVAAVHGACIGVGITMIVPFDRIVIAPDAKVSIRFVKLGLVPELASTMYVPLRCGWGAASDLMLSGRNIDGTEAVALGLADEVAPASDVLDVAVERARSYAENPPQAVRWIKQLLTEHANATDPRAVQRRELELLMKGYASDEHKQAVADFLQRRG
jgi:2-(1,2-epoxy-1,2-dihydrophenyl)acetyl-CoA isomerase